MGQTVPVVVVEWYHWFLCVIMGPSLQTCVVHPICPLPLLCSKIALDIFYCIIINNNINSPFMPICWALMWPSLVLIGRSGHKSKSIIFKLIEQHNSLSTLSEIALRWMPQDFTNEKSMVLQVMDWCHQATSHYLSQCCPRSMSPYGITRSQCVKFFFNWCWDIKSWL